MAWTGPCSDSFWAKPKCKGSKHPFWSLPLCFCKIDNFVHSSLHSCRSCSKVYHNRKIGNGVLRNCPLRACLRVAPVLQRALGSPACRVSVKIFSESSIRRKTLQVSDWNAYLNILIRPSPSPAQIHRQPTPHLACSELPRSETHGSWKVTSCLTASKLARIETPSRSLPRLDSEIHLPSEQWFSTQFSVGLCGTAKNATSEKAVTKPKGHWLDITSEAFKWGLLPIQLSPLVVLCDYWSFSSTLHPLGPRAVAAALGGKNLWCFLGSQRFSLMTPLPQNLFPITLATNSGGVPEPQNLNWTILWACMVHA